jgi:hypothetical protein
MEEIINADIVQVLMSIRTVHAKSVWALRKEHGVVYFCGICDDLFPCAPFTRAEQLREAIGPYDSMGKIARIAVNP